MAMEAKPHSTCPLFWLALAAATGVFAGVTGCLPPLCWIAVFGIAALTVFHVQSGSRLILLLLATASAFAYYSTAMVYYYPPDHLIHQVGNSLGTQKLRLLVTDEPRGSDAAGKQHHCDFSAEVRGLWEDTGWKRAYGTIRVRISGANPPEIQYGDLIETSGFLRQPNSPRNPGEFDYRNHLASKGIFYECIADPDQTTVLHHDKGQLLVAWSYDLRRYMLKTLQLGLQEDAEISALMSGMLFGYRDGISEDVQEAFRKTGTLHLFAVSGQNVAEILGILLVILQLTGVVRWRWAWLTLPGLLIFCLATGMQSSAARAFVMASILLAGWALCRPVNALNIAGAAALLLLACDPRQILDCGFQLSFLAVVGLVCGSAPLTRRLHRWYRPDPWIPRRLLPWWRSLADKVYYAVCGMMAASISAWLATCWVLILQFHVLSPVTLLANFCVVPLAGLVVTVAALSVFAGWIWGGISLLLNQVSWLLLKILLLCRVGWPLGGSSPFYFLSGRDVSPGLVAIQGQELADRLRGREFVEAHIGPLSAKSGHKSPRRSGAGTGLGVTSGRSHSAVG